MSTRASTAPARRFAFLIIAAVMLLTLPSVALGAKGNESRIEVSSAALIGTVSPGETLAFRASFVNHGPGTITHLRFEGTGAGGKFEWASHACAAMPGTDNEGVACELGSFAAQSRVDVTLVFSAVSDAGVTLTGLFGGDAASGNETSQSTDVWPIEGVAVSIDGDPTSFSRWQLPGSIKTMGPFGTPATQVTTVVPGRLNDGYAASLTHSIDPIECSNAAEFAGVDLSGFGQAVDMDVADGGTSVHVKVTYAPGTTTKPLNKIAVVHQLDSDSCVLVPGCDGTNAGECFVAYYQGQGRSKQLVIEAWLPNNGRIKGI